MKKHAIALLTALCVATGCTASADLCSRVLALPLSPYITRTEQDQVIDAILTEIQ